MVLYCPSIFAFNFRTRPFNVLWSLAHATADIVEALSSGSRRLDREFGIPTRVFGKWLALTTLLALLEGEEELKEAK